MTFAPHLATLVIAAAVLLFPVPAPAQRAAGGTICACPGLAKPLGSAPNCDVACNGARSGGGGGTGAAGAAALQFGTQLGEAWRKSQGEKAERERQAANQRAIDNQRAQERKRLEDEARKDRLLSGMQGVEGGGELTLMMGDEPMPESRITIVARARDRHNQEAALRRAALARLEGKPEAKWCKLHLPQALSMPLRLAGDEQAYSGKLGKFARDRSEWDKRCGGPAADGPTPLDGDLVALQRFDNPKLVPVVSAAPASAQTVTSAAAAVPAEPALQAGGLSLMSEEDLPRAAPKMAPEPEPVPAPAVESPAPPPAGATQRKGWTAESVEAKAPHVVEAGTPGMPPPAATPVFPAALVAGKDAVSPLSFSAAPAAPGAYAFMSRAPAPAPSRGAQKPKFDLLMFTKGVASAEDGVRLAAASVNVLYNLGAAPNETGESRTTLVFEKDETDKGAFETEKGVATLPVGSIEWKALTAESVGPNRWLRPAPAGVKR